VVKLRLGVDVSSQSLRSICVAIGNPPESLAAAQAQPAASPKAAGAAEEMGKTPNGFSKFEQ
jgi:hypothetical protein